MIITAATLYTARQVQSFQNLVLQSDYDNPRAKLWDTKILRLNVRVANLINNVKSYLKQSQQFVIKYHSDLR